MTRYPLFWVLLVALAIWGTDDARSATVFTDNFDTVDLGDWPVDRFAPAAFQSVPCGGNNCLAVTISEDDGAVNRDSSFSSTFYNTQGRSRRFETFDPNYMSIDMRVDSDMFADPNRVAGFWGIGYDEPRPDFSSAARSSFPILELANGRFQGWDSDSGTFVDLGPAAADQWFTLAFALDVINDEVDYFVDGVFVASVPGLGTTRIGDAIIQVINTNLGLDRIVEYDNLIASDMGPPVNPIPLPPAVPLFATGIVLVFGYGSWRRWRRRTAA